MEKNISLTFHHIGKPVSLQMIQHNKNTKYSPLFDMYSLDLENDLSIPIELHAFGPNSSLDVRIQTEIHIAFTTNDIEYVLTGKEIIMPLYQPFAHYRCAMVSINGQLIEFIETSLSEKKYGERVYLKIAFFIHKINRCNTPAIYRGTYQLCIRPIVLYFSWDSCIVSACQINFIHLGA